MQRPDDAKRRAIVNAATTLFSAKPFHEVRLDDVAAAAHIGKGTLYVYFDSKDALYASTVYDGLSDLVEQLRKQIEQPGNRSACATLRTIILELVRWAEGHPDFFQNFPPDQSPRKHPKLRNKRRELGKLIEAVIEHGNQTGELDDPRPDLTAQFIPAFVRSSFRHGPSNLKGAELAEHIIRVLCRGISRGSPK
jgi:AcrR family transcriptional regulator